VGRRPTGRDPGEENECDRAAQESPGAVRKVGGGHPSGCDPGEVIGRGERSESGKERESDGEGGRVRDQADQDGSRAGHKVESWCPYEHDPGDQLGGPGASRTAVRSGCSFECHLRRGGAGPVVAVWSSLVRAIADQCGLAGLKEWMCNVKNDAARQVISDYCSSVLGERWLGPTCAEPRPPHDQPEDRSEPLKSFSDHRSRVDASEGSRWRGANTATVRIPIPGTADEAVSAPGAGKPPPPEARRARKHKCTAAKLFEADREAAAGRPGGVRFGARETTIFHPGDPVRPTDAREQEAGELSTGEFCVESFTPYIR
jgi:hypothetical protein